MGRLRANPSADDSPPSGSLRYALRLMRQVGPLALIGLLGCETPRVPAPDPATAQPSVERPPPSSTPASVGRVKAELGPFTVSILEQPSAIIGHTLDETSFNAPADRDFTPDRVGGFPIIQTLGPPAIADFGERLRAILFDDRSIRFEPNERCDAEQTWIGLAITHQPTCGPKASCSLDQSHVVLTFPCHQVLIATRTFIDGKWRGKVWSASFGPAGDQLAALLKEAFPNAPMPP